jgi:PrcB C-terminal
VGGDAALCDASVRLSDLHLQLSRRLKLAALAAVAVVTSGWLVYDGLWREGDSRALAYRDLTSQLHVQPTFSFVRRFSSGEQLADYVRRTSVGGAPPPRVDFRRDEALLVSAGPRSSTGYALRVVRAVEERGRIVVTVRENAPTLRNPGRPRLTYPYRLLVFARTHKPVYVRWVGRP